MERDDARVKLKEAQMMYDGCTIVADRHVKEYAERIKEERDRADAAEVKLREANVEISQTIVTYNIRVANLRARLRVEEECHTIAGAGWVREKERADALHRQWGAALDERDVLIKQRDSVLDKADRLEKEKRNHVCTKIYPLGSPSR